MDRTEPVTVRFFVQRGAAGPARRYPCGSARCLRTAACALATASSTPTKREPRAHELTDAGRTILRPFSPQLRRRLDRVPLRRASANFRLEPCRSLDVDEQRPAASPRADARTPWRFRGSIHRRLGGVLDPHAPSVCRRRKRISSRRAHLTACRRRFRLFPRSFGPSTTREHRRPRWFDHRDQPAARHLLPTPESTTPPPPVANVADGSRDWFSNGR